MKNSRVFTKVMSFVLSMLLVFTLVLFNTSSVAYADGPNMGGLAIYVQDKNNVTLTVDVQGGSGYPARLEWGDGTYVDLPSGYGQHIWHSYPYEVGWFKSYTASLYVPGVETCRLAVGINDYCGPSFSNLYLVELGHNELTVGADVNGPGLYPARIDWGDGTYVDLPDGSGQNIHHAYAYDVGAIKTYTMTLYVVGTDPCVATYTIDDTGLGQSWMSGTIPHTGQTATWEFPGSEPVSHSAAAPGTTPISSNNWAIGNTVNLAINTQIRTGSGLGYTVHTVVPVNNWPVTVINGPRYNNGYTWWDISRSDGGTGWVRQDQADNNETSPSTPQTPVSSGLTVYSGWSGSPWSGSYLQVTVYNLRLRSSASLTASVNGYVVQGQYYKLLETQGDWGRIETQNSTQGWIYLPGYTITTQVNQNPPVGGVCYLITPHVHSSPNLSINEWFAIDIPSYLDGKNYEIYYKGSLVPDAGNGVAHNGYYTPAGPNVITLGISTRFVFSHLDGVMADSNWQIRYNP